MSKAEVTNTMDLAFPYGQNKSEVTNRLESIPTPAESAFELFEISSDTARAASLSHLTMAKVQQAPKTLTADYLAFCSQRTGLRKQNMIVKGMMVSLSVIMQQVRGKAPSESLL